MLIKLMFVCGAHALYSAYVNMDNKLIVFHELIGVTSLYFSRSYVKSYYGDANVRKNEMNLLIICACLAFVQFACYMYLAVHEHRLMKKSLPLCALLVLMIHGCLFFMKSSSNRLESVVAKLTKGARSH